jgi:hypothetical protein
MTGPVTESASLNSKYIDGIKQLKKKSPKIKHQSFKRNKMA